jgi:hypothetical protein
MGGGAAGANLIGDARESAFAPAWGIVGALIVAPF